MRKKGLSLIELLIIMTLIAIVMPIITSIYITGIRTFNQEMTQTRLQADAQTILDEILNDTKNAQSVEQTLTEGLNTYSTSANSIILNVPAIDSNQVIQYQGTQMLFDKIIYYYENNNIHKVVFADASSYRHALNGKDKILASNILVLTFAYDPDAITPTLISATVTNQENITNLSRSITVTGKARLRNHI